MITHRLLPPAEWDRLTTIPPFNQGGLPNPTYWRIIVVERDGEIVATCALFDTVHWDGFWMADGDQGNPVVFRKLLEGGLQVMQDHDIAMVHTTVPTSRTDLADMLLRFGFQPSQSDLFFYMRKA